MFNPLLYAFYFFNKNHSFFPFQLMVKRYSKVSKPLRNGYRIQNISITFNIIIIKSDVIVQDNINLTKIKLNLFI
jgi:hypothetical protein